MVQKIRLNILMNKCKITTGLHVCSVVKVVNL